MAAVLIITFLQWLCSGIFDFVHVRYSCVLITYSMNTKSLHFWIFWKLLLEVATVSIVSIFFICFANAFNAANCADFALSYLSNFYSLVVFYFETYFWWTFTIYDVLVTLWWHQEKVPLLFLDVVSTVTTITTITVLFWFGISYQTPWQYILMMLTCHTSNVFLSPVSFIKMFLTYFINYISTQLL